MIIHGVIFILATAAVSDAQTYCDSGLCRGRNHVTCGSNAQFPSNCDGVIVNIQLYIDTILQEHNAMRDRIAGGNVRGFPPAVRMGSMTWDDELAKIAVYNAVRCKFSHDECRNTRNYRYSGQNLSILYTRSTDIRTFIRQRINSWFNEYQDATSEDVREYIPRGGSQIGHFTVMVHEKNNRIGCAISQFTKDGWDSTYLVCNYAVTNVYGNPIYRFGAPTAECNTGSNPNYPNLCSTAENYNHNEWSS